MKRILFELGLILICTTAIAETSKSQIDWLYFDFPPYHFFEGDFKGTGIVDPIVKLVERANPEFEHSFVSISIPRAIKFMERPEENHCFVAGFMDDSLEKTWVRSKPVFREIPPLLAMKRSTLEQIGNPSSVNLKQLLTDYPSLKFGRASNQTITESINQFLATYEGKNLETVSNSQSTLSLHRMLAFNRVDYIVTYGAEIGWIQASTYQEEYESIVMVPIEEASSTFNPVYVACPRIGEGEKIIEAVNDALNDTMLATIWLQYMNWLPDPRSQVFFLSNQKK